MAKLLWLLRAAWLIVVFCLAPRTVVVAQASEIESVPLSAEAHPRDKLRFVQLSAAETGIHADNRYEDPKMKGELYQEFDGSSVGTGVAIGDYDGDGLPDIFVVRKTESCRLFRNLGNWKFEDVTEKAGVADRGDAALIWKQGVAFVDVNNDGLLDIYICRFNAPNLLYINQGNGTFKEEAAARGLAVNDSSVMAAFCDYDRDGWLDVYITTNLLNSGTHPEGQKGYLFHNNRDGTFSDVTDRAGTISVGQSHSATWWDYDNDGWPDLYIACDYGVPDKLYHNNRDGSFTNVIDQALPHTAFSSMGADFGDVNNDGLVDLLVADMAATTHETDQRLLADMRGKTEEKSGSNSPVPKYHRNALLLGTGTAYCIEAANLAGVAATDWTWSVRFEDLDNDGLLDLFVTNGFHRTPSVDAINRLMNASSIIEQRQLMLESPVQTEANIALRNRGNLQFENVGKEWGLDQRGVSFGTAFGDLDGDGDMDIVYTNYRGDVTVLRNESTAAHRAVVALRGTVSNRYGVGAKVTIETSRGLQVRPLFLARGYLSTSEPMVHFGLGDCTAIRRLTVAWPSGCVQKFENLPVDRRFTVTEPAAVPTVVAEAPQEPPQRFQDVTNAMGLKLALSEEAVPEKSVQRLMPLRLGRRGPTLAIGREEDTGATLLAIGGSASQPTQLFTMSGKRGDVQFEPRTPLPAGKTDAGPLLWFDADGDGRNDLFVTASGDSLPAGAEYQPRLYLGQADGSIQESDTGKLPRFSTGVGAVAAADFDHDGRLDLFIGGRSIPGRYPLAPESALWRNRGGGQFEDVTEQIAPDLRHVGLVTAALWSDVDGDGWCDLLVATEWGQIVYFHNHRGEKLENWTERAGFGAVGPGWWTSLASADFNGDGRPDFVVGNVGLNTQYRADPEHPALLFADDFKDDGSLLLLEAYDEGGELYPWRSRRDLGAVFPFILKRYPKNGDFARASLEGIFGKEKLAKAIRFAATEFRSGVFLSGNDGIYHFHPLPRLAQIAPAQGIVAGDFDGDGKADIYLIQNSFAPIPAVGHFDGGLSQLLLGDGNGNFLPVSPRESNLIVPGEATAVVLTDFNQDGWPDFIVARHQDGVRAFQNVGVVGRHSVSVTLHGTRGNPTAVGARASLELQDGSVQTSEVQAGSGGHGQSTATLFFGYPDKTPPRKIRICWPDGTVTDQACAPWITALELTAPSS